MRSPEEFLSGEFLKVKYTRRLSTEYSPELQRVPGPIESTGLGEQSPGFSCFFQRETFQAALFRITFQCRICLCVFYMYVYFVFLCVPCVKAYFENFFRFLVREFVYDEQALEAGKNEITKLESDKKKQFVSKQI